MRCIGVMIIFVSVHCNCAYSSNISSKTEHEYLLKVEQLFNRQSFDSCLYYQYLLANKYIQTHDSSALTRTWFNISWLEILQERYIPTHSAKILAEKYMKQALRSSRSIMYNNMYYGLLLYKQGAYRMALSYFQQIENNSLISPHLIDLTRIFSANAYAELRGSQAGIDEIEKLLQSCKAINDTTWFGFALSKQYMGLYLFKEDKYLKCIETLDEAINLYENIKILDYNWIESHKLIIEASWYANRLDLREDYFRRITKFLENGKISNKYLGNYYMLKGVFYFLKDDYQEAVSAFQKALSTTKSGSKESNSVFEYLSRIYFSSKEYVKIIDCYHKLRPKDLNKFLQVILAYSYYETGNKAKALQIMNEIEITNNDFNQYLSFFIPAFYFRIGNNDKAEYYYLLYLNARKNNYGIKSQTTSIAYSTIAYFYWYARKDYVKSLYYYHNQIYSLLTEKYTSDYYALPDISKSINDKYSSGALNNKAEALYEISKQHKTPEENLRHLNACLANLELSLTVAHRYKMNLVSDKQRYSYADYIQHRYSFIIKICLELYQKTGSQIYAGKAFEYAEKSKSSLLLSTIRGIDAYKMNLIPDNLKKNEDLLWSQIELVSNDLSKQYDTPKPDIDRINILSATLYKLKNSRDSLILLFKQKYPAYYNAKFNSEVVSVDTLQKRLMHDEAVLQYSISRENLVIFLVTDKAFKIITDTTYKQLFADIEAYRKFLSHFSYGELQDTSAKNYTKFSNRLYNHLIKPFESYLARKKLIIIPDDVLSQISFDALITIPTDEVNYRYLPYLIRRHSISYSYSATLFSTHQKRINIVNPSLLAIAPDYPASKNKSLLDSLALLPIPGTYKEVENISRLFKGNTLMRKHASEENFKTRAGQYDVLHLAMHGIIDDEYPMLSKLVFTPAMDSVNEGFLNTYEIYNMHLNASLVVLSACNSGYGKLHSGEGIASLARGFYIAGAQSIVMTLWRVEDEVSSELMYNFYRKLSANQMVSDALRSSKLAYIENNDIMSSHPYFWAGYINTGNTSLTFETKQSKNHYIWFIGGVLVIGILLYLQKIRTRFKY